MVHISRGKSIVRDPSRCGVVARKHVGMLCRFGWVWVTIDTVCKASTVAKPSFGKAFAVSSSKHV